MARARAARRRRGGGDGTPARLGPGRARPARRRAAGGGHERRAGPAPRRRHAYHRHHFTRDEAVHLLHAFRAAGLEPCVYVEHDDYEVYLGPEPSTHPEHAASFGDQGARSDFDEVVDALPVFMFGLLGQTRSVLDGFSPSLATIGEAHVSRDFYGGHGITVVPRGLSKWVGVRAYCDAAGLDPDRVLAIGDGPNDVELEAAAVAVVPADGHDDVVALADHVVASPRAGGWAELLDLV